MKKFVFISQIVVFTIIIVIPNKFYASNSQLLSNLNQISNYLLLSTKILYNTMVLGIINSLSNKDLYTQNYDTNICYSDKISAVFIFNKFNKKVEDKNKPYIKLLHLN